MPWKGIKDPYKIWLSEVILQQTRVEQGWGYYERFVKKFPTINDLASAPEHEVFKLWEGLGYYSRCRNLMHTAKKLVQDHQGIFPASYEGLLLLKGIGPYTASAIASFAFNLPTAVVDGNVIRVLARFFGIEEEVDKREVRKFLDALAQSLIDHKKPAAYNQAMMDFGATVCKPSNPDCDECPLKKKCKTFEKGMQSLIPRKLPKRSIVERWFYYLVLETTNHIVIRQRTGKDIWLDLHEFLLKEVDEPVEENILKTSYFWGLDIIDFLKSPIQVSDTMVHQLTHQKINCRFVHVRLKKKMEIPGYQWIDKRMIDELAFHRLITRYLEMNELS